ncbi:hypothetical protein TYRP_005880 [Tyrophagus putrescentiae]|nr:hypothetical protein TYRP_005880 [Tyrophagus putrescentiae]
MEKLAAKERHSVTGVVKITPSEANNATVKWLAEAEQSIGITGKQVNLKVGIVGGIALEGTQKGAQVERLEGHYFQLGEYGWSVGTATGDAEEGGPGAHCDGGENVDNLLGGRSVNLFSRVNHQAVPFAEMGRDGQRIITRPIANNATVQWLTEAEQSIGIAGEQVNLKVSIVSGVLLEGTHKGLQSSETVDGGDQLMTRLTVKPHCCMRHEVGQLALPLGMLQKGQKGHQVSDGGEIVDNLLDGRSVNLHFQVNHQAVPFAETSGQWIVGE